MTAAQAPRAARRSNRWPRYALLAGFFALADVRLLVILMPKALLLSADVAEGVVRREPLWRVYQSRLLGPYLLHALAGLIGAPAGVAYGWFTFAMLSATGLALLLFLDRLNDPGRPAIPSFLLFQVGVIFLLPCLWIYPWDLVSLFVFTVFCALVLLGARRAWFVALYGAAIFNHELALFIAAWLVVDPIARHVAPGRKPGARFDWPSLILGAALVSAGLLLIGGLRQALLIRETQPGLELPPDVIYGRSFHVAIARNWYSLSHSLDFNVWDAFPFLIPAFLFVELLLAFRLVRSDAQRFGGLALVLVGMVIALLMFGLLFETRVMLPLIPFIAMNGWAVFFAPTGPDRGSAATARRSRTSSPGSG